MATEDTSKTTDADTSAKEARRHLIRLITRQDMDEHDEIYEELARE
ncbi:hypothetical protein [Haladaptatus cibarius]|nr:hypothetical protein [Haladaptatus cibarius]